MLRNGKRSTMSIPNLIDSQGEIQNSNAQEVKYLWRFEQNRVMKIFI